MRAHICLQDSVLFYISLRHLGNNRAAQHTFSLNNMYEIFLQGNKNQGNIVKGGNKNENRGNIISKVKSQ